jgi:hypothetical protein
MLMKGQLFNESMLLSPKKNCNKIRIHALLILAHESGGFADRHCRLVIGYWGPMGCEVKFKHLTGVGGANVWALPAWRRRPDMFNSGESIPII